MTLKNDYSGLVEVENDRIIGSVKYFKEHPDDVGAMIFMTSCSVQGKRDNSSWWTRTTAGHMQRFRDELRMLDRLQLDKAPFTSPFKPLAFLLAYLAKDDRPHMWLVMGIADYVRFFKYEPGKLPPLDSDRMQYNATSKATAAFLAFLTEKYDKDIVRKLNRLLGKGEYRDAVFQDLIGKTLPELNEEWRASVRQKSESSVISHQ
jgi:hypothetical protein